MATGRQTSDKVSFQKKSRKISKWLLGILASVSILSIIIILVMPKDNGDDKEEDILKQHREHTSGSVTGTINGHDWVDLGLPSGLKWADCNVGADTPEGFGDYYAWGETATKSDYSSVSSLTYRVSLRSLKKSGIVDDSGTLTRKHDAASVLWGDTWRMPTDDEFLELITSCKWEFTALNGVNGYKVTGPNHQSIFLPAAAFRQNMKIDNLGEFGDYWSSTAVRDLSGVSCSLGYSSKSYGRRRYARYAGRTIRPVTE